MEQSDAQLLLLPSELLAQAVVARNRGAVAGRYHGLYQRNRGPAIHNVLGRGVFDQSEQIPATPEPAMSPPAEQKHESDQKEEKKIDESQAAAPTLTVGLTRQKSKEDTLKETIRALLIPPSPSLQSNRVPPFYFPPMNRENLKSLLTLMDRTQLTQELAFSRILARLCVYRVMRSMVFHHILELISSASPRYSSRPELMVFVSITYFYICTYTYMYVYMYVYMCVFIHCLHQLN
ncbi:hypothetical protein RFI_10690 [Reticulomyxa filosa]|uniref:Uncharacterized protein n=1 Tax=Reticulomyxa filosa TaxID=46433 RepID=X6NJH4_RETFI|nr:hypothetical protein RFI_10690 [Reticulomyxa filosa]|eukprot:ETO26450.1 hypothetical protein RFI_10690 [Reticulomyxa filosa]